MTDTDLANQAFTWNTLKAVCETDMVPKSVRGKPAAALALVFMGRELGLGPMASLNMIDHIDGSPSLSSELQTAMIRQAGHSMIADEITPVAVTVTGTRRDNGDTMTITYSLEMADRAGLTKKGNWKSYPEAMMWARSVSMLARMLFADVFTATHVYTADELGDDIEIPDIVEVDNGTSGVLPGTVRTDMDREGPVVLVDGDPTRPFEDLPDRSDAV